MNYKTIITEGFHKAKHMAAAVEKSCNEMAMQGYELVTLSITASEKAILVFKTNADAEAVSQASSAPETETI